VLSSVRTGALATRATVSRYVRVRSSVEQVSMLVTPSGPTTNPVLFTIQLPSGCT
jgi:hypothetical protein